MSYALTSSLGKARIVVNAVPECSGDSERRAHGGEGGRRRARWRATLVTFNAMQRAGHA